MYLPTVRYCVFVMIIIVIIIIMIIMITYRTVPENLVLLRLLLLWAL